MAKKFWGEKKITEIIKNAETIQSELKTIFDDIQKTSNQINSVATEANEKLANISSVKNQADETLSGVKTATSDIQSVRNEIGNLKLSTDELLKTNQSLVEQIKNQLGIAAGGSLSHTFDKRKEELEKSKNTWRNLFLLNIVALLAVAAFVFLELKDHTGFTVNAFLKITLSFPLIYSAIFFHGQYNKEREYLEEYAFKSAVSFSLEAYKKLLVEDIDSSKPEEQKEFIKFIIDSIRDIYNSPCMIVSARLEQEENIKIGTLGKIIEIIKKLIKE